MTNTIYVSLVALVLGLTVSGCFENPNATEEVCNNTCQYAFDGVCDDGGPNSQYSVCDCGTDCADCGTREVSDNDCLGGGSSSSSSSGSSSSGSSSSGGSSSSSSGSSSSSSGSSSSSSSSSSGGSSTATVQFFLRGTYSGRSLQCLLPLTIKVYKVQSATGFNYCEYGSSACECGSSFFNFLPSGIQSESYGTQIINIAEGTGLNPPACGASGVASYQLPPGNYVYRWESSVCCNSGGWNKKCFGSDANFTVTNSDTQQSCKRIEVYMPILSSNSAGLNWIQDNCPF